MAEEASLFSFVLTLSHPTMLLLAAVPDQAAWTWAGLSSPACSLLWWEGNSAHHCMALQLCCLLHDEASRALPIGLCGAALAQEYSHKPS